MDVIGRKHVRVSYIVLLHHFDVLGIRNRNQNIFARDTESLGQNILDIGNVLEDF